MTAPGLYEAEPPIWSSVLSQPLGSLRQSHLPGVAYVRDAGTSGASQTAGMGRTDHQGQDLHTNPQATSHGHSAAFIAQLCTDKNLLNNVFLAGPKTLKIFQEFFKTTYIRFTGNHLC